MHLSEGILPLKWAAIWYVTVIPFIAKAIADVKKKARQNLHFKPLLGLIAAAVFIISCMPVPVPTAGTCSHPCGTAISAIFLGPFMSILVTSIALMLQALLLAHGGISTWGANIVSMGIAGSFTGYAVFKLFRRIKMPLFVSGFFAGILADWAVYTATAFELASALHGDKPIGVLFNAILIAFIPTQVPLGILEGFLTGGMIVFVARRRPDILAAFNVIDMPSLRGAPPKAGRRSNLFFSLAFLICVLSLSCQLCFAQEKWSGVDKSVIEKVALKQGRAVRRPFINTDQGDLLLFLFLIAGVAGGFIIGYNFRKLFSEYKPPKQ